MMLVTLTGEKSTHGSPQNIDSDPFLINSILLVFVTIEQNGTKREKIQVIEDFVYDKFEEARNRVLSVHDHDLRRWALQKAAEDSVLNFQASEHWLRAFKHRHRICSRKITKLVTRIRQRILLRLLHLQIRF